MNRRSFVKSLAAATASFAILPSAATYARAAWKKSVPGSDIWVINPEWRDAPYEIAWGYFPGNEMVTLNGTKGYIPVYRKRPNGIVEVSGLPSGMVYLQEPFPIRFAIQSCPIPPVIKLSEVKVPV